MEVAKMFKKQPVANQEAKKEKEPVVFHPDNNGSRLDEAVRAKRPLSPAAIKAQEELKKQQEIEIKKSQPLTKEEFASIFHENMDEETLEIMGAPNERLLDTIDQMTARDMYEHDLQLTMLSIQQDQKILQIYEDPYFEEKGHMDIEYFLAMEDIKKEAQKKKQEAEKKK